MKKRNLIKIISIYFCLTIIFTGCGCQKNIEDVKTIDEEKVNAVVLDDQKIDNITFKDFNIAYQNNISSIAFEIFNETENVIPAGTLEVLLYNDQDKLVFSTNILFSEINSSASDIQNIETDIDLSKVKRVEYILK